MKPVASEPKKKKKKEFNPSSNLIDSDHKVGTDITRWSLDGISVPGGAKLNNCMKLNDCTYGIGWGVPNDVRGDRIRVGEW